MFKLALRNILRHKVRTLLTAAAIAFGVCAQILSGGFIQDIFIQLGESLIHSQSGHLQISRSGYFTFGSRFPDKYLIESPEALLAQLTKLPEVQDAMVRINFSGLINNGRTDWAIIGEGMEAEKEARLGTSLRITAGRQLGKQDLFAILLGQGVAKALNLRPGNNVSLVVNTPEGALNTMDFQVAGIFQSFSREYDDRAVRIPLQAAQELLGTRGVNSIVLALHQTAQTEHVAQRLNSLLEPSRFEFRTWIQLNAFYTNAVTLYDQQFGVLRVIILCMVLLSVGNSVNMSVFERVGEFGTMMALGNRRRQIVGLIITECALLGVFGSLVGMALGMGLATAISAVGIAMPPPPNANIGYTALIRLVPAVIAGACLVGLLASTLASILPAFRVIRTPVVDALRQNI